MSSCVDFDLKKKKTGLFVCFGYRARCLRGQTARERIHYRTVTPAPPFPALSRLVAIILQPGKLTNNCLLSISERKEGDFVLGGGGGDFFLACEDVRRMFDDSFPPVRFSLFLCLLLLLFSKWRLGRAH